jgi:hypothetical protein
VQNILSRVAQTVGSLESPDYRRVKIDVRQYARLIAELSHAFWIRDTSDDNQDFSYVLLLRQYEAGSTGEYILYISNLANYAFAMMVGDHGTSSDQGLKIVNNLLNRHKIEILPKHILSIPVDAKMFYADRPTLFNVLFSDSDYLPWEETGHHAEEAANDQ